MADDPRSRITAPGFLKGRGDDLMDQQRRGVLEWDLPVLTVPGRRSGEPRRTPLTVLERDGERFVLAGYPGADWIRNVRAAGGRGTLHTGVVRDVTPDALEEAAGICPVFRVEGVA